MIEKIKLIFSVFRIKRWYRNSFMLFSSLIAIQLNGLSFTKNIGIILLSFLSISLIASGNYGINEVFDAKTDKLHPQKKFRAIPAGKIKKTTVIIISLLLYVAAFCLVYPLKNFWLNASLVLFILNTGILYNIPPIRLKDLPYLDFIVESFGNSVRLLVGWYAVTTKIVPISFILIFWCIGIFLMAGKRFAEIRYLDGKMLSPDLYRKSLGYYTQENLLLSMICASSALMFMFGVLSVKYEIDMVIMLPLLLVFLIWYFRLAYQEDSIVKDPERVFENKPFVFYSLFLAAIFLLLIYYHLNIFGFLLEK
ncbi:MAG: UbiA family prenyltransferase [Patescibacteria group bacterium]